MSYSMPLMDAFLNTSGALFIQPKVSPQGNSLSRTLVVLPSNIYSDKSGGRPRPRWRKVLSMISSLQPSQKRKEVTLKVGLEHEVKPTQ